MTASARKCLDELVKAAKSAGFDIAATIERDGTLHLDIRQPSSEPVTEFDLRDLRRAKKPS